MKKRFQSLALLPVAFVIAMQAVNAQEALHVHKTENFSIESAQLENIRHLTFVEDQLLVTHFDGKSSIHELDEVTKLTFGESFPSEVITPTAPDLEVVVYISQTNEIVVESAAAIQSLALFNVDGKILQTTTPTTISASSLPAGVYLLQIITEQGTIVKKVIKK